jgi:radical SAM superfamily enzyme YgiQ (UPF0313 family)
MFYAQPVYRPLSEAQSLLIQATIGCSQPTCTFCLSSAQTKFQIRSAEEIKKDLDDAAEMMAETVNSIFFLAGDAFVMRSRDLCKISSYAYTKFPNLHRVSSYATAKDILRKTSADLKAIRAAGYNRLYVGVDSGNDRVLTAVRKGINARGIVEGCRKAIDHGFTLSVTVILGLGGLELSVEHARDTAAILSEIQPDYLGIVTLMPMRETAMGQNVEAGRMLLLNDQGIVRELRMLFEGLEIKTRNCVVRSNHPSNYMALLSGTLPNDRHALLSAIDSQRSANESPRHPLKRTL